MRRATRSSGVCSKTENFIHRPLANHPNHHSHTRLHHPGHPVISLIGNRPALQIGRYQVIDYDIAWLDDALRRAANAADHEDFPFITDIRSGIEQYLETKCPLRLLQLEDLFERVRMMLVKIGWESIAEKLELLAPPMTVSLVRTAMEAGNGFELAFFETLRVELAELRAAGAEEIRFTGLRESSLILRGSGKWNKQCDVLLAEIEGFLKSWQGEQTQAASAAIVSGE